MKEATFDPSKELTLYFRCNRAGSKNFVFTYSDGSAYSFIYDEIELNIYKNQGDKKKLISLTHVSGITLSANTVTASITKALSNISEGEYYWELYRTDLEQTWLNGNAFFHNGIFDGVSSNSENITVSSGGDDVNISITPGESTPNYNLYVALLSQSGTDAPVATVLENSLGGTVVWTRANIGEYTATLASAFTANKTMVLVTTDAKWASGIITTAARNSDNDVVLYHFGETSGTFSYTDIDSGANTGIYIEIRVYN